MPLVQNPVLLIGVILSLIALACMAQTFWNKAEGAIGIFALRKMGWPKNGADEVVNSNLIGLISMLSQQYFTCVQPSLHSIGRALYNKITRKDTEVNKMQTDSSHWLVNQFLYAATVSTVGFCYGLRGEKLCYAVTGIMVGRTLLNTTVESGIRLYRFFAESKQMKTENTAHAALNFAGR